MKAKEYFSQKGIKYTDFDCASNSEKAREMVAKSGQRGTPVIIIDGEMVIGFHPEKLDELLGD
ncbi:glutaredoxin domain-containing protein [Chloroflexota bacterium]